MNKIYNLYKFHEDDDIEDDAPFFTGDVYTKLAMHRSLFINEAITEKLLNELITMLLYLDNISNDMITLYINSPGGIVSGFLGIYDVINFIKSPIRTVCTSECSSAAALLLACGKKGYRYATKSSRVMIHGMSFGFPDVNSTLLESKEILTFAKNHEDDLFKILSKHTGQKLDKIKSDCKFDYYMNPKEAKEYGIIDHIA